MYRDIATTIYKRGQASMDGYQMPSWVPGVLLLNLIIFLPFTLIVSYTFQHVYPTIAIVEDPLPPAYAPVALDEGDESASAKPSVVTASLRGTHRAVYAAGGWRSLFRGFAVFLFLNFAKGIITAIFTGIGVPAMLAVVIVPFVLVQPYATWTHTIISATPSSKSFWKRFPPFKKAFRATALPVFLYVLAKEASVALPLVLSGVLGMKIWNPSEPNVLPQVEKDDAWKGLLVLLSALALHVFLVIPAQVVLTRVQASFLPEEEDTIVPFDRTFGGKVEPAVVGGKGYVNMADAWKSFSGASWVRLIKLYLKIFLVSVALSVVWAAVIIPEYILIANKSRKVGDL
ncbi:ubiquitin carrier protein [Xylariaceae sp. FL0594]|nr:ubiquitin carrier protein [Xylariaceae sp. FL0594]